MNGIRNSLVCLIIMSFASLAIAKDTLGIFLPLSLPPKELEASLEKDPLLQGLEIKAFSQIKDFYLTNQTQAFDFVILPSPSFRFNKAFTALYQLTYRGAQKFRYQVVTLEKEWTAPRMAKGSIGLIEELERPYSKPFVKELMEGKEFKRIKQVTRVQDLYPMLALGNANYILMAPNVWDSLEKSITAKPLTAAQTQEVNYPQIGFTSKRRELSESMKDWSHLAKDSLEALGFNGVTRLESK